MWLTIFLIVPVPMSLVIGVGNVVSVSCITVLMENYRGVFSPRKQRKPMTALYANS